MRTEHTVGQGACWSTSGQVSRLGGGMITSLKLTCARFAAPVSLPKSDMPLDARWIDACTGCSRIHERPVA